MDPFAFGHLSNVHGETCVGTNGDKSPEQEEVGPGEWGRSPKFPY